MLQNFSLNRQQRESVCHAVQRHFHLPPFVETNVILFFSQDYFLAQNFANSVHCDIGGCKSGLRYLYPIVSMEEPSHNGQEFNSINKTFHPYLRVVLRPCCCQTKGYFVHIKRTIVWCFSLLWVRVNLLPTAWKLIRVTLFENTTVYLFLK